MASLRGCAAAASALAAICIRALSARSSAWAGDAQVSAITNGNNDMFNLFMIHLKLP
jgi:hypothetical protein